jgi:proteasome lid subunit RPN8/RPN11
MKIECKDVNKPRILITPEAKQRLDLYILTCHEEISGLGQVELIDGFFVINEIMLFEQEVTAGSTNLDRGTISKFLLENVKAGKDTEKTKLWWHSHVNGSCFWSGTDNNTMEGFTNDWMLAIVGNKRGEYQTRLDMYSPVRVTIDELNLEVFRPFDKDLKDAIAKEVKDKVKKAIFNPPVHVGGGQRFVQIYNKETGKWEEQEIGGNGHIGKKGKRKAGFRQFEDDHKQNLTWALGKKWDAEIGGWVWPEVPACQLSGNDRWEKGKTWDPITRQWVWPEAVVDEDPLNEVVIAP